ncbi:MAG: hypothetical protein ACKOC5_18455 [Chloroflexota bacterium]
MMDSDYNSTTTQPAAPAHQLPPPRMSEYAPEDPEQGSKKGMIIAGIVAVVFLALIAGSVYFLTRDAARTANIRDVFIIFLAAFSVFLGLALVVLIVQLARLINLLQNEIKPILDSTNETVSHLRGTTVFLSDNLVEPVIKLNEYMAGMSQFIQVIGLMRKPRR